jgi:hypothetical protein
MQCLLPSINLGALWSVCCLLLFVRPFNCLSILSDVIQFFRGIAVFQGSVAGLSLRSLGFNPSPVQVGFVVDSVALTQVLLQALRFPLSLPSYQCSTSIHRSPTVYNHSN